MRRGFERSKADFGADRAATLASVAAAAGVSRQTVSNIFNAPHKVQLATRRRVEAEIARQGYRPNRSARSLRIQRSGLVGYCVKPPSPAGDPIMDRFVHSLCQAAERDAYHVLLFAATPDGPMAAYEHLVAQQAVDGFVISDTTVDDARQEWFQRRGVPFAAFGRRWSGPEIGAWIDIDGAAGVAAAVHHLAELGHRRLAFIGWPEGSGVGDDRCRGFREAAVERGLAVAGIAHTVNHYDDGRRAAAELLAQADPPTAVVCVSDELAVGCDTAIRDRDLVPGRDVAVTGFDDTSSAALPTVSLTSVRQPLQEVGDHVVRLLVDALRDPGADPEHVLLVPELVVRHSTDHPDRTVP
ncbi:MAG: LacI family DNA-binding transcriptional regulator [Acidimicrobiia bacterium]|nr:LacI family DNA-binding transcriptional regulator [Acidimicrobiia bacterium]